MEINKIISDLLAKSVQTVTLFCFVFILYIEEAHCGIYLSALPQ
jgi:hypothetical protein